MTRFREAVRDMDPFSDEADEEMRREKAARAAAKKAPASPPPRPARPLASMREIAEFVHDLRTGLGIKQAELAARAGVSRTWIVALEQGRRTVEAGKVLRTLEALGYDLSVTPYDPPPPWMVRAVEAGQARKAAVLAARYRRRNTRREAARRGKLVDNVPGKPLDLN